MEKKNEKRGFPILPALNVLLVTVSLAAVGAVSVLYGNRPTVSEIEKRALVPLPAFSVSSFIHGQYTKQLSAYFADTFPAREALVRLAGAIREHRGFRFNEVWFYDAMEQESIIDTNLPLLPDRSTAPSPSEETPGAGAEEVQTQEHTESSESVDNADSASPAASSANIMLSLPVDEAGAVDSVEEGVRMGAIFIYKDSGYTIFGGSDRMGQWYAQVLNTYQNVLGDHMKL